MLVLIFVGWGIIVLGIIVDYYRTFHGVEE